MQKLHKLLEHYQDDASNYDDFDDEVIGKVITKLKEALSSLNEHDVASYTQTIKEVKNSLQSDEEKKIVDDFITYCKHHK
jgi:formiminotetrahydrofolate cyclodeaminase